jgi:hypothetical protein
VVQRRALDPERGIASRAARRLAEARLLEAPQLVLFARRGQSLELTLLVAVEGVVGGALLIGCRGRTPFSRGQR